MKWVLNDSTSSACPFSPKNPKTNCRACAKTLLNSFSPTTDSNFDGNRSSTSESRFLRLTAIKIARQAMANATNIKVLVR